MSAASILGKYGAGTLEQIIGYGVGGALTPVVEWAARPIAYEVNAVDPNLILDPQTLVIIEQRLSGSGFSGEHEAAEGGINSARYAHLLAAQFVPPGASELLELLRRNELKRDEVVTALLRGGMAQEWIDNFLALEKILMSPADLAMARQQGFIEANEQHRRAALQGVDATDADLLFELSGLPPGADTAVELLARGEIGHEMFAQMIREGHTKTKYIPQMEALRWQPLSASIAAEALVRERMTEGEAVAIAEKNRIKREDFLKWSDMLGRPMATGEALTLVRRGQMTPKRFREVVARSDVRTEYTEDILKLRRNLPPLFQVSHLVSNGSLTPEMAVSIMIDEGYDKEVAHGIVEASKKTKTKHTRDLAAGQIDTLYESGLESREWALKALHGLGYDEHESEWHLELLDAKRLIAALQADLALIHRQYVNHKIDEQTASGYLDQIQIAARVRDTLLQTWTAQREANVSRLTNAQIGMALKHAGMSRENAVVRWQQNGYSGDDANWLADIALKTPHNAVSPTP